MLSILPIQMAVSTLSFVLLSIPSLVFALQLSTDSGWEPYRNARGLPPSPYWRRDTPSEGYYNPLANGGSMLTQVNGTNPVAGEPINIIMSAFSDSAVLKDTEANGGLRNYWLSFGFSSECLGQHAGDSQGGNLGDGNGYKSETAVIRWDYGDPKLGSCNETIEGGNHFRYWFQNGPSANSGAVFMATSYEFPIAKHHDIVPNGYNLGRDWLVGNATAQSTILTTTTITNASTFSGQTSYGGYTYRTNVQYVSGLLQNTSDGINHAPTVGVNGANAIDGLVAVLGVTITAGPKPKPTSSATWTASLPQAWRLPATYSLTSLLVFSLTYL